MPRYAAGAAQCPCATRMCVVCKALVSACRNTLKQKSLRDCQKTKVYGVTSSVHGRGCPPSARKGGLGGGVRRQRKSRDLRVEQAHAFLREREIQRENVCSAVHLCVCVINVKNGSRQCQRHWRHKADNVKTENKHPEAS